MLSADELMQAYNTGFYVVEPETLPDGTREYDVDRCHRAGVAAVLGRLSQWLTNSRALEWAAITADAPDAVVRMEEALAIADELDALRSALTGEKEN